MFQYIILTQYEYQEISKNWPGENHFLDLQVYHPLWKWENSSPKDSDSSPALPPFSNLPPLTSLFQFGLPNFQPPLLQFLQALPYLPTSTSTYPICPAQASPHLPTALNVGRFGLFCQVFSQGHFHLGARWLTMEDPIERELVVNSIHKYQNTWPESLEAHWWLTAEDRDQICF